MGATQPLAPAAFLDLTWGVRRTATNAFPGAMMGSTVMSKFVSAVEPYGLTKSNVIYGQSVSPDELSTDPGQLTTLLTAYYGHAFPLGGLGGAPFAGKTGFAAFSHHVPDDGHVVVVFGPHIGYTPDGQAGKFLRRGQSSASTACGALAAAYHQLISRARMFPDFQDAQQEWLRAKLAPHIRAVSNSKNPPVTLVKHFYKIVEEEVLAIVNTDWGKGNLVLLGGISINLPYPHPGYFLPLHFSVRSKTRKPEDLMPVFG